MCSFIDGTLAETVRALRAKLETSRASRRRAWEVLQEFRKILTDLGNREIPPPKEKSIQAEGVLLKQMLRVCLEERNEAIAGLAAAARRVDKA
ncbi:MAG: hypothetical protein JO333_10275 [Verrucomicrobia bacterium]|nr:hypothetical protein [Verrucomicrobiota bacterium]